MPAPVSDVHQPLRTTFDILRNVRHIFSETPEELSATALYNATYNHDQILVSSSWGDYRSRSRYDPPDAE